MLVNQYLAAEIYTLFALLAKWRLVSCSSTVWHVSVFLVFKGGGRLVKIRLGLGIGCWRC